MRARGLGALRGRVQHDHADPRGGPGSLPDPRGGGERGWTQPADVLDPRRELTGRDGAPELAGTVEQVSERLRSYGSVGIDRVMLQHLVHEDVEMVALIGEVGKSLGGS